MSNNNQQNYKPLSKQEIEDIAKNIPVSPDTKGQLQKTLAPEFEIQGNPLPLPNGQTKTLCLVMIVKDEEDCIECSLESVSSFISYWIICDTGSSDKTKELIMQFMKKRNIPGKLYSRPWHGYDFNRNESLSLSFGICDYRILMDADDELKVNGINPFNSLEDGFDCYDMSILSGALEWRRAIIINSQESWLFKGIIHEFLVNPSNPNPTKRKYLHDCLIVAGLSANRKYTNPKDKYLKDVDLLRVGLLIDPENARYQFYLGQSYLYAGQLEQSSKAYEKRIEMGGWNEEVYYSLFNIGVISLRLEKNEEIIINNLSKAYERRPSRLEALFTLIHFLVNKKRFRLAYIYAVSGLGAVKKPSSDTLFVDQTIWRWRFAELFSVICSQVGQVDQAVLILNDILKSPFKSTIPPDDLTRIEKNLLLFSENSEKFKI